MNRLQKKLHRLGVCQDAIDLAADYQSAQAARVIAGWLK